MTRNQIAQEEYDDLVKGLKNKKEKNILTQFFNKALKYQRVVTDWGRGWKFEAIGEYGVITETTYYDYTWRQCLSMFIESAWPKYKEYMS